MKTISALIAGLLCSLVITAAHAADPKPQTVVSLHQNKTTLAGKTIAAQGKVVKVNNGIMGRNFVHIQDGSGDAASGSNNLVVTSKQTANVGEQVSITGTVVVNREFGAGYSYPLLIEDAAIAPKK